MGEPAVAHGGLGVTVTLSELARRHQLSLTRFAFLLGGDRQHAEDVVQEVLTAMFRRFGETLPVTVTNPVAYARAAVVNMELSRTRRKSAHETPIAEADYADSAPAMGGPGPRGADGWTEDVGAERSILIAALSRLPARSRAAVVLRYYEDLTVADVAAALGCREGTAASLLSRAVAVLRNDTTLGGQYR